MLLDCRSLDIAHIPIPDRWGIVVANSMVKREVARSAYNERRAQCAEAAASLGLTSLREATPDLLGASRLPPLLRKRAEHVATETARTLAAAEALRRGDPVEFGRLMLASHASLRDDYEVSCAELDALVDIAREHEACYGARLTGAGFGGCTVSLVRADRLEPFSDHVRERYSQAFGVAPDVLAVRASQGAGVSSFGRDGVACGR
jgi:galactokinase